MYACHERRKEDLLRVYGDHCVTIAKGELLAVPMEGWRLSKKNDTLFVPAMRITQRGEAYYVLRASVTPTKDSQAAYFLWWAKDDAHFKD